VHCDYLLKLHLLKFSYSITLDIMFQAGCLTCVLCLVSLLMLTWTQASRPRPGPRTRCSRPRPGPRTRCSRPGSRTQASSLKTRTKDSSFVLKDSQGPRPMSLFSCEKTWTIYCADTVGSLCSWGWSSIWCSYRWRTFQSGRGMYIHSAFLILCN